MSDTWRAIEGYRWPYRINEDGVVQKFYRNKWVTMMPRFKPKYGRVLVTMQTPDGKALDVPVVWLMADAFLGGRRPGHCITYRDGLRTNPSRWNLIFVTRAELLKRCGGIRRKAVLKIDRDGEVVEIYRSATEAAKANFMSRSAICLKCEGKVKDPRRTDGYDYKYEDGYRPKKACRGSR